MIARILLLVGISATVSLACVDGTKCIPDVAPRSLTVVRGDVDAVLVSEFALTNGCISVEFDSLVRRFPAMDTMPKLLDANGAAVSRAAALHLHTFVPKLDSATAAKCSRIRTLRRIDTIPRIVGWSVMEGTEISVGKAVPVSLDSLAVCIDGSCTRVRGAEVRNPPDASKCLIGMYAPQKRDTALAIVRKMLESASEVVMLRRMLFLVFAPPRLCRVAPPPVLARATLTFVPAQEKETRFTFPTSNASPAGMLPQLVSWSDPRVTADLALPRPSNAGDFFAEETLVFRVTRLRAGSTPSKDSVFRYATGVKYYQYQGFRHASGCDTAPAPTIVGDTLRLDGPSLQIGNDGCGRKDVDGLSNDHYIWLFAPRTANWQWEFRHGSMLDNGPSFPIIDDSVQAFGWRFTLDELMGTEPALVASRSANEFAASLFARILTVRLERPSIVRIASPSGQIVSSFALPAGVSERQLPQGVRGVLLVSAGSASLRVLAP